MALRGANTTGKVLTEEELMDAASAAEIAAGDAVVTAAFEDADVVVAAAAATDLNNHLEGPPTGGALTVVQLDALEAAADSTRIAGIAASGTIPTGDATGAVALRLGDTATEGWELHVLDQTVDMLTTPAAAWDLAMDIPAGAVILGVQVNLQDAITANTATKVGIGVVADPNKYGMTSGLTANLKVDTIPAYTVLSGAEDIQLYAVDNAGDAAGTIGGGTVGTDEVRVRIVYAALNSLDNV